MSPAVTVITHEASLVASLAAVPEKNNRGLNAVFISVTYILGFGSIVIGAVHFHNCPAQEYLPVCLIIFGMMVLLLRMLNCISDWRSICDDYSIEDVPEWFNGLNTFFLLASIGMFLAVCLLTFTMKPITKPEAADLENYCHYTLYRTSFYGSALGIILFVVPVLCACCAGFCYSL